MRLQREQHFHGIGQTKCQLHQVTSLQFACVLCAVAGLSKVVRFTEVSFFHKPSRTLLVTDAVVYVDKDPPACIPDEVRLCYIMCYIMCYNLFCNNCVACRVVQNHWSLLFLTFCAMTHQPASLMR
jgi:hypothetical protein